MIPNPNPQTLILKSEEHLKALMEAASVSDKSFLEEHLLLELCAAALAQSAPIPSENGGRTPRGRTADPHP